MDTTEPKYFTEFRKYIENRFDESDKKTEKLVDDLAISTANQFDEFRVDFNGLRTEFGGLKTEFNNLRTESNSLKTEFGGLKTEFNGLKAEFGELKTEMNNRFEMVDYEISVIKNTMATKDDIKEILSHIGRYEIRTQNIEETLKADHEPRIKNLEKALLAI